MAIVFNDNVTAFSLKSSENRLDFVKKWEKGLLKGLIGRKGRIGLQTLRSEDILWKSVKNEGC